MAFIEPCFGIGHNLSLICQMTSEDIKHQLIIIISLTKVKLRFEKKGIGGNRPMYFNRKVFLHKCTEFLLHVTDFSFCKASKIVGLRSTETLRLIRKGKRGYGGGGQRNILFCKRPQSLWSRSSAEGLFIVSECT